jgi:hypothetical protein
MIDNLNIIPFVVLPDGKCSNCKAMIRVEEEKTTIYKNRLLAKNKENGCISLLCPKCSKFLAFSI